MLDFMKVISRQNKSKQTELYPEFLVKKTKDLMIRGGDFYAIWDEEKSSWTTDPYDALTLIDREIEKDYLARNDPNAIPLYLRNGSNKMVDTWKHYIQKQLSDNYHPIDETLVFANDEKFREQYSSHSLPYALAPGSITNYEQLMDTLYDPSERRKLEWGIGAVVAGESKEIQKFIVIYGSAGTGKSTFLNIVQMLFDGYYATFEAKALGMSNASFALEAFKSNPLVAIQQDGDLSKIEDNTRLNSLIAHEEMVVNEKFKSMYTTRFNSFLFMGTNKPVKITDAKSGILRRLIDVYPTGNKLPRRKYDQLMKGIKFELGAIAYHCMKVFEKTGDNYYDEYIPTRMLSATNDFYGFIDFYHEEFLNRDYIQLVDAWSLYKTYCEFASVPFPYSMRSMGNELMNYYEDFQERYKNEEGRRLKSVYIGFRKDKFRFDKSKMDETIMSNNWLNFASRKSILDEFLSEEPAQLTNEEGNPKYKWEKVRTKLKDINTKELHFVLIPNEHHIVIDFDLKDRDGNKSLERNLSAAAMFPPTYSELSKSGKGIHLHYFYKGDVSRLERLYSTDIEIKVFTGKASLRRRLTACNNLPISTISSGLPLKEESKMATDFDVIKSERGIRKMIERNLRKEIHGSTKPSVDFIYKILEDAYKSGIKYDVSDMKQAVMYFASNSTNQADKCLELVAKMHFTSKDDSEEVYSEPGNGPIAFYDIEVFPNLFLVNWKLAGENNKVVRMINPSPMDIEKLVKSLQK